MLSLLVWAEVQLASDRVSPVFVSSCLVFIRSFLDFHRSCLVRFNLVFARSCLVLVRSCLVFVRVWFSFVRVWSSFARVWSSFVRSCLVFVRVWFFVRSNPVFVRSQGRARRTAAVNRDYELEIKRSLHQSLINVVNLILQHFSPGFGKVRNKPGRRWRSISRMGELAT